MHVLLIGLNHKSAPLEIRERVSFSKAQLADALPLLADRVGEAVILSTCNRTEVYTVADDTAEASSEIRRFLSEYQGAEPGELLSHLYELVDSHAAKHLFRVASGLDSMILGESEILGQVGGALTSASESQTLGAPVSRLFHRAIKTGRMVREETDIGRNTLSVSYAAVHLAQKVLGGLAGLRVLLIGAGEAGQLVARALRASGVADMTIANRTPGPAEELSRLLHGRAVPFDQVDGLLAEADIVIAATEAPEYVLSVQDVAAAAAVRRRPTFIFDLSVPRNVDPAAGALDGVSLYNIDDLSAIAQENLEGREQAAADAERIVDAEVARFMAWWDSLEAVAVIKALRQRADLIRRRELAHALHKLDGVSPEVVEVLDAMSRAIVNKLLHDPTVALKRSSGKAGLQATRALFKLYDDAE